MHHRQLHIFPNVVTEYEFRIEGAFDLLYLILKKSIFINFVRKIKALPKPIKTHFNHEDGEAITPIFPQR